MWSRPERKTCVPHPHPRSFRRHLKHTCVSESVGQQNGAPECTDTGSGWEKAYAKQKVSRRSGLRSREETGAEMTHCTFFSEVSMSAEAAPKSDYLPFSSINFCNINDKGRTNRLLINKLVIIWVFVSMSSKQPYTVFSFMMNIYCIKVHCT